MIITKEFSKQDKESIVRLIIMKKKILKELSKQDKKSIVRLNNYVEKDPEDVQSVNWFLPQYPVIV